MIKTDIFFRECKQSDMEEVIEILQAISVFKPSQSNYLSIWDNFCKQQNTYSLVAIIDNKIIGYGALVIEKKIRGGKVGHVEDIVTHPNYKKKGIGKLIVDSLYEIAEKEDCYKLTLQCKEQNVEFYKKCDYEVSGVAMQRFIKL